MDDCVLFVGLGNPGSQYDGNRHNVGFKVVDAIVDLTSSSFKKMDRMVDVASFSLNGRKIVLAKPLTFMNLSGRAVRFVMDFYKIGIENIYVFHDDIDLDFARIKIKKGGGNGGHNGLKSIDSLVGKDYWRIRIGISRPEEKAMISSYVLHDFYSDERDVIENICSEIAKNIDCLISDEKKLEAHLNLLRKT
jgi:PTH1 family peptidyl-tRNA hydrolase